MNNDAVILLNYLRAAKRVYIVGNGGSAANAIHIANDLISCGIKAQSLTSDIATITAIANDFGYEYIFSRQLGVLGEEGDLLIVLSGSGNSQNIIHAIHAAHMEYMKVIAITGAWQANQSSGLADYSIQYGENMQIAEDYQLTLIHQVYRAIKGLK